MHNFSSILQIFILSLYSGLAVATALDRRATCTPVSGGSASIDDVPAIEAAFKSCGAGGIIIIPAGKTYMIRSVLDFTGCVNCEFQIEGTLKMSEDLTFWNGARRTLYINQITGLKMRSVTGTGLVDGKVTRDDLPIILMSVP